jgi:ribonuclease HI
MKVLQPPIYIVTSDAISMYDENPAITLGPHIEDGSDASPPFYISLNFHDKLLHNCLMDSGASHTIMPKVVMEELGLEITKPYQHLYSFDFKKVKCLGLIKDLVVSLALLPMKSVVMDIVVANIPPKFGMILSRTWAKKVGGSLQMDLTYATIPVFGGEHGWLYRQVRFSYIVSDHQNLGNHPVYVVEDEIGSYVFHLNDDEPEITVRKCRNQSLTDQHNEVWKMCFDRYSSKEVYGVGIVLISLAHEVITLSYKLEFETTNNIAKYEALVLGLRAAKDMAIDNLPVFCDSELIINQVKNIYLTKQQRLKQYRNEVWDLVDNLFLAFNISFIPREANHKADSLALDASTFRPPIGPNIKYQVEVRYRTAILDNIKHWQAFSDDLEIQIFLHTIEEFPSISIDQEGEDDESKN